MAARVKIPFLEQGFKAWAEDLSENHVTKLPQTEIIPLVCLWRAIMDYKQCNRSTTREFIDDVLASDVAVSAFVSRLERGEASAFMAHRDVLVPLSRYDHYKNNGPWRYDFAALNDGRADETYISVGSVVVGGVIGHAAYNSTDGNPLLTINPLGPPKSNPDGWKILDFPRVIDLVEKL